MTSVPNTIPNTVRGLRQRYRPTRTLPVRPPISSGSTHRHPGRGSTPDAGAGRQPREGFLGLVVVALLTVVLLFAWDGALASSKVLGVLVLYALPVRALIALWWEDWPGARLRPRWSGWVDLVVVVVSGTALAALAQAVVQHLDPAALFMVADVPGHVAPSPGLLPLGAAVFTVFLQLTLVTEGWPLRARGRLVGGAATLGLSWVLGLALERATVATGLVPPAGFLAALTWISAVQVLGWVVLRGAPFSTLTSRSRRLLVGNLTSAALGLGAQAVLAGALHDELLVGAVGAAVGAAGLVVGMLFEGWPTTLLRGGPADVLAVLGTLIIAGVGLVVAITLADDLGVPTATTYGWASYAMNTVAAATIVHVGLFRRWPLPTATRTTTTTTSTAAPLAATQESTHGH